MNEVKLGFELRKIRVPLSLILPLRRVLEPQKKIRRYDAIVASIKAVGLVEPLVVHPQKGQAETYLLVDGHLRYHALKDLGEKEADCIISRDDECFTYNARINRLAPIQEHKMITKAVRSGVSPEKIAAALNLPLSEVRDSMTLLDGINEEAADLLKDKAISAKAIRLLKRVTGIRQIEIAELMVSANNFTTPYASALVFGTSKDLLMNPEAPTKRKGLSAEDVARLQKEMEAQERDFRAIEESYGESVIRFAAARAFIRRLLENARVIKFLTANYPDVLSEFQAISAGADVA